MSANQFRAEIYEPAPYFSISVGSLSLIAAFSDATSIMIAKILASLSFGAPDYVNSAGASYGFIAMLVVLGLGRSLGLYRLEHLLHPERIVKNLLLTVSSAVLLVVFMLFLEKESAVYSRGGMLLFALFASLLLVLSRFGLSALFSMGIDMEVIRGRRVVLIGDLRELEMLRKTEVLHFGFEEIARFGLLSGGDENVLSKADRDRVRAAMDLARDSRAVEFALVLPWSRDRVLAEVTQILRASPLAVRLYPDRKTREILRQKRDSDFNPHLSVKVQREPLTFRERLLKRLVDLVLSASLLVVLAPLFLVVAAMVKLDTPGPVFFRQRRCGFDNREFLIWKFRSMTVLEDGLEITQAQKNDVRVTAVGKVLRRTSVDELPQLINVLLGEMSLVGPRPHAIAHHEHFGKSIAEYSLRHHVKPGLTGVAQVRGCRGETRTVEDMEKRVQYDIWYANNWSIGLDLLLLLQTFGAVMRNEAY